MAVQGPKGVSDLLPTETGQWQRLEAKIREVCSQSGYGEVRLPIFEHTELFLRGIGEATDIVEKEMYTFQDKGGRSLTLRPEGTAGVVRVYLEKKLFNGPSPTKLYYIGPMFRYEQPQAGRYRQFHQFGLEAFGEEAPSLDAEIIATAMRLYQEIGLTGVRVHLHSIGCPECRQVYRQRLREYLSQKAEHLCPSCRSRLERNPMRILDCKREGCREETTDHPLMLDSLCVPCHEHFSEVQSNLTQAGIEYEINPRLVRGFDYYTRTVFEFTASGLGAQDAIGGGGRYDGLVEELGGPATPAVGFAAGLERVLLSLAQAGVQLLGSEGIDCFLARAGAVPSAALFALAHEGRKQGLAVEMEHSNRSLKAQMKAANRLHARYVVILGEEEWARGEVTLKPMGPGEQRTVSVRDLWHVLIEGGVEGGQ